VLDAWHNLWCAAPTRLPLRQQEVVFLTKNALDALKKPLPRGGRLDRALQPAREDYGFFRTFSGVYVLLLRSLVPVDDTGWPAAITEALPRIQALTLALPPPDGPGSGSAAGFGVA
jgi:hypothetical protein